MKKRLFIILISVLLAGGNNAWLLVNTVNAKQPEEELTDADRTEKADASEADQVSGEENGSSAQKNDEIKSDSEDKTTLQNAAIETIVPIYNYEVDNVIVPTTYAMSLNPYEMPIIVDDDHISTEQVVSRKYGVINKSSTDKIVTITFTVEDLNKDKITFVNSAEEARNADEDVYAVYLSVIPANEEKIQIGGAEAGAETSSSALSDVEMGDAKGQAIALHAGENRISFKLSKAIYNFGNTAYLSDEKPAGNSEEVLDLISLNPDGKSVTAFTFGGAMNPKAEWEKLLKGVKVTATYDYHTADGSEEIVSGTGAMISID